MCCVFFFCFQAEDGIRDRLVTGVQTCALPICSVVAAGAVVLEGTEIPPNTLFAGVPAKSKGPVSSELAERLRATADRYVDYAGWFKGGEKNL